MASEEWQRVPAGELPPHLAEQASQEAWALHVHTPSGYYFEELTGGYMVTVENMSCMCASVPEAREKLRQYTADFTPL
jgi:hypothetical protein